MSQIDVIVPCYGYGHFLRQCVESVLSQQGVDLRVLVLDDASPDDTPVVAAALVASDSRVEYRRHAANQGHISTYNEGLAWARGDYTLLLDADDVLTSGALARAARLMDAHPAVALAYGPAIETGEPDPRRYPAPQHYATEVVASESWIEACCRIGGNRVPTPTAVCRTSTLRQVGGYRPDLPHAADMELWYRLGAAGPVGIVHCPQAFYRRHEVQMSRGYAGLGDLRERKTVFEIFFTQQGERFPDRDRLRELALRRVAQEACRQATVEFLRPNASGCRELLTFATGSIQSIRGGSTSRGLRWLRLLDPLGRSWLRWLKAYVRSGVGAPPP